MLGIPAALLYAFDSADLTFVSVCTASGGLVGGLVGMAFGGAIGSTEIYSVNYDSSILPLESHPKEK